MYIANASVHPLPRRKTLPHNLYRHLRCSATSYVKASMYSITVSSEAVLGTAHGVDVQYTVTFNKVLPPRHRLFF